MTQNAYFDFTLDTTLGLLYISVSGTGVPIWFRSHRSWTSKFTVDESMRGDQLLVGEGNHFMQRAHGTNMLIRLCFKLSYRSAGSSTIGPDCMLHRVLTAGAAPRYSPRLRREIPAKPSSLIRKINRAEYVVTAVILSFFLSRCDKTTQPREIDPRIVLVKSCCVGIIGGDYRMGVWSGNTIYTIAPLRRLTLTPDFQVSEDSLLVLLGNYQCLATNRSGTRLLLVASRYTDVSVGALIEMDPGTQEVRPLRDSSWNISSAVYLPGDSSCVYYSYGGGAPYRAPGYYYLSLTSNDDNLVMEHLSEIGPSEVTNGFDVRADGQKLLVPINYAAQPPKIVEVDLLTHTLDTLHLDFDRQMLWLRYNPVCNQILFCNYARGSGGSTVWDDSRIGVIDRATLSRRDLNVNPDALSISVSIFPNWSPSGKHIVYGSAVGPLVEPPGSKGPYSLYILKDVN